MGGGGGVTKINAGFHSKRLRKLMSSFLLRAHVLKQRMKYIFFDKIFVILIIWQINTFLHNILYSCFYIYVILKMTYLNLVGDIWRFSIMLKWKLMKRIYLDNVYSMYYNSIVIIL